MYFRKKSVGVIVYLLLDIKKKEKKEKGQTSFFGCASWGVFISPV